MKTRILRFLKELSEGKNAQLAENLAERLGLDPFDIQQRASDTLSDILHQYGRFSVVTIDSFFHQVIRSFAREMGLQGTFSIDLDLDKVLNEVIDEMLLEIGEEQQRELREWLTQYAAENMEDGKRWEFTEEIKVLAGELLKDRFKLFGSEILKLGEKPGFFKEMKGKFWAIRKRYEDEVYGLADQILNHWTENGLGVDNFSRKSGGPAGMPLKLKTGEFEITAARREAAFDRTKWLTKAELNNPTLNASLDVVLPLYQQLIDTVDGGLMRYHSAIEVQRYLRTLAILSQISKYLERYRDEKDVMLISDLPDFLHQIIRDSDTPYIYEKVGSLYQHFLIDEFQDTSAFQWENFRPLVKNATDAGDFSMVVGDVKQSIYRFRGGNWQLLQSQVKVEIGDEQTYEDQLTINWRSAPEIVDFNNAFFRMLVEKVPGFFEDQLDGLAAPVRERVAQKVRETLTLFDDVEQQIRPDATDRGYLSFSFLPTESKEESWQHKAIEETIRHVESLQRRGYALRDMAILTRTSREGRRVADAFLAHANSENADPQLRYEVISAEALFLTSSHAVRLMVSVIKWLADEKNVIALAEWLFEYRTYIQKEEVSYAVVFGSLAQWKQHAPAAFVAQKEILKTVPVYELVERLIQLFDLNRMQAEFTYMQGFQDAVLEYSKNERGDMVSFLKWWEQVRRERPVQVADENNAIKILTVHKSKGLEFPVVILPFLGWSTDNESNKDNILWCAGATEPPFDQLPVVPLRYSSALSKTYWAEDYYDERLKALVDNLNLLYVAFTRAAEVLIAFAELPTKAVEKPSNVGQWAYLLLQEQSGYDASTKCFEKGELPAARQKKVTSTEFGLTSYRSYPWREKVNVQMRHASLDGAFSKDAAMQGIAVHRLLSKVCFARDLSKFEGDAAYTALRSIVTHPQLSEWFDPVWQVDTEVPILLPGGDLRRIDRINRKSGKTIVIDFKTGVARPQDQKQVQAYLNLLGQMDFEGLEGYLVYLENMEVVAV